MLISWQIEWMIYNIINEFSFFFVMLSAHYINMYTLE